MMVKLYDPKKVMEIHDYNVAKEARQEEKEIGIRAAVRILKNMNASQAAAVKELMSQFGILYEAAEEKVKLYWGQ